MRYSIFCNKVPLLQFFCSHHMSRNYYILVLCMFPLAFTTAEILLGILSIRFWHTSSPILSHSTCTLSHKSRNPAGALSNLFLRWFNRFSMGLRSGDWAGHGRILNPWSLNYVVALLHLCFRLLSCWKMMLERSLLQKARRFWSSSGSWYKALHPIFHQSYMHT